MSLKCLGQQGSTMQKAKRAHEGQPPAWCWGKGTDGRQTCGARALALLPDACVCTPPLLMESLGTCSAASQEAPRSQEKQDRAGHDLGMCVQHALPCTLGPRRGILGFPKQ